MNKYLVVVACFVFVNAAYSDSGSTIHFQGEVTDETCTISVDGNSTSSIVLLPAVSAASLANSGDTAGETPFTVGVHNCSGTSGKDLNIKTIFLAHNITRNNRIGNTGSAKNVSLEIVKPEASKDVIDVTGNRGTEGLVLKANEKSASHGFAVRYKSDGKATAGTVLGSVQYSISYQ